jgi:hypothetical protein
MLIPNLKFLVLPVIALAVIASLPSPGAGKPKAEISPTVTLATPEADCLQAPQRFPCAAAMQLSAILVR